ncbi:RNA polymerase sigma factor [Algoriphagus aquimarinus]|uniref:Sigma-70 family RNA polymerase sigma factor n=1 Tax=Algoriphagus aquimarinus TaxID=237018 RepID=A0A5C7AQU3_9BACT|nr:sigma-70 family RNA polymerase sigma factor [Algoriphagus aquimarinus]TXE11008.1 sigma-70 family RNA polymerase sigma factor [Algoriphagus aquimarinus]
MGSTVNLFISRSPKKTSNSQLDDKALWQSVRKGNDLAFSNLYQRYSNLLFNYGMHFCYNRELVKDCIQELFTTIWNRREALSEIDSVKYYLFKSFRNLLVQHISNDRKRFVDFNDSYEFEESDSSIESSIIIEEYLKENKQKIAIALFKISKRQREIVILKYFNDLSYAEISSLMDLTPASAHNLLSKALQCLRVVINIFLIGAFFLCF